MKQNFFDHLDGGWGDIIADTYKDANKTFFLYDKHLDIKIFLDEKSKEIYKDNNIYSIIYKDLYNKNYTITFSLETSNKLNYHDRPLTLGITIVDNPTGFIKTYITINGKYDYISTKNKYMYLNKKLAIYLLEEGFDILNKQFININQDTIPIVYFNNIKTIIKNKITDITDFM